MNQEQLDRALSDDAAIKAARQEQPPPMAQPELRPTWELVISDLEQAKRACGAHTVEGRVLELVIGDARDRDNVGRERYGTPLTPYNGRDSMVDAYHEALDLSVYLRNLAEERPSGDTGSLYDAALMLAVRLRNAIDARDTPGRLDLVAAKILNK